MKYINIKVQTTKGWTTHMTMLLKVIGNSTGPVLEVGGGPFSTPLLHWMCKMQNRKLVTYENEPMFYQMCKTFQSGLHTIRFIENWDDMDFNTHWGVVFIDHHPDVRRVFDLINFKDKADYIVCHDTEKRDKYSWDKANKLFKYQYIWKDCRPWTSVYSNFKSLEFLK
jgi:hypothetical protein